MAGVRFRSHGLTHVGHVRRRNEDAFLDLPERGLWAVADGMGGHEAGDYASARIVAALGEVVPPADLAGFVAAVNDRLGAVDRELRARAARLGPAAVIASTVVALLAGIGEIAAVWAGDSRLYRWHDGALRQITTDHSRVQEMVDAGRLPPEEAAGHPLSHIVTRAIGAGPVECASLREPLHAGDRFLLCTDGLTNVMADAEIAAEVAAGSPQDAAERLRDLVLARGAPDNVTIVAVFAEPA